MAYSLRIKPTNNPSSGVDVLIQVNWGVQYNHLFAWRETHVNGVIFAVNKQKRTDHKGGQHSPTQ